MADKINHSNFPEALEHIQAEISEIRRIITAGNHTEKPQNQLMVIDEAAKYLSLSKASIYRLVSARSIHFHKNGGKLYFLESELLEWVKSGRKISLR